MWTFLFFVVNDLAKSWAEAPSEIALQLAQNVRNRTYLRSSTLAYCRVTMDKISSDRVRDLCSLIQTEQDQERFLKLIQELNRVLGDDEDRAESDPPGNRSE
ncbi:MAG: hypothetical protein WA609_18335 [Terriglobales bacterium]